mmetsp:Transcript_4031/g.12541  ORF Transcript_4031/g.12541 Transcript_4031/m.12541 type:complete len:254 (+) Transcript_4031:346-1107(+)
MSSHHGILEESLSFTRNELRIVAGPAGLEPGGLGGAVGAEVGGEGREGGAAESGELGVLEGGDGEVEVAGEVAPELEAQATLQPAEVGAAAAEDDVGGEAGVERGVGGEEGVGGEVGDAGLVEADVSRREQKFGHGEALGLEAQNVEVVVEARDRREVREAVLGAEGAVAVAEAEVRREVLGDEEQLALDVVQQRGLVHHVVLSVGDELAQVARQRAAAEHVPPRGPGHHVARRDRRHLRARAAQVDHQRTVF